MLLLTGSESTEAFTWDIDAVADALPDARIVAVEGQQHVGDVLAPGELTRHILAFMEQLIGERVRRRQAGR